MSLPEFLHLPMSVATFRQGLLARREMMSAMYENVMRSRAHVAEAQATVDYYTDDLIVANREPYAEATDELAVRRALYEDFGSILILLASGLLERLLNYAPIADFNKAKEFICYPPKTSARVQPHDHTIRLRTKTED